VAIVISLDELMTIHGVGVNELADRIGITPVNVSVLKNGRAKAVRFTTLEAICRALDCQPGDVLRYVED
jgi:putative transcriptional regulator